MSMLDAALDWAADGWAVVPLHWIRADGTCSCGNPRGDPDHDYKAGGKHPIHLAWGRLATSDPATIRQWWAETPEANIGGATGERSGRWVLDVDPDNGGSVDLLPSGLPPDTQRHITGSGGTHLIFAMDRDITNARGDLPAGLDVRGTGGQIVLPPSRSGKGTYHRVPGGVCRTAPGWLNDIVKPPRCATAVDPHLDASPAAVGPEGARGAAYAARAVPVLCTELAEAAMGTRNHVAFRVAARLLELCNAGWLNPEFAEARYLEAAALADERGHSRFPESEARAAWRSAERTLGGKSAELPPDVLHGTLLTVPTVPRLIEPGVEQPPAPPPPTPQPPPARGGLRDRLLSVSELLAKPRPAQLIEGLLTLQSGAWLIGAPGCYKSFVAMSIAAHVAAGRPWLGMATEQRPVIYILAEGTAGAGLRFEALRFNLGLDLSRLWILPEAPQASEPAPWHELSEVAVEAGAGLIVIDTQARVTCGIDENSKREMDVFVSGVIESLKMNTGACVLTVHHTGSGTTRARGTTAIDGAEDTELLVSRPVGAADLTATLSTTKQKDLALIDDLSLQFIRTDIALDPRYRGAPGVPSETLYLAGAAPQQQQRDPGAWVAHEDLALQQQVTNSVRMLAYGEGASITDVVQDTRERLPDRQDRHIRSMVEYLASTGVIAKKGTRVTTNE